MILAGDVGGTKVHLALYDFTSGKLQPIRDQKFPAHQFATLDDVVNTFLTGDSDARESSQGRDHGSLFRCARARSAMGG